MRLVLFWLTALLLVPTTVRGLTPDELLLITNRNVPEGRALAEFYAAQRKVPAGRLLEISLPITEEVAAEQYDEHILPAVRQYLEVNGLKDQVKCLVTFYGMPLRLRKRAFTAAEQEELRFLQGEVARVREQIERIVEALEQHAVADAPDRAAGGDAASTTAPTTRPSDPDSLGRRADAAFKAIESTLPQRDEAERRALMGRMIQVMEALAGPAAIAERLRIDAPADSPQAIQLREMRQRAQDAAKEASSLQGEQHDPAARKRLRELVAANFGLIAYAKLVNAQLEILNPVQTTAALDGELALLWWEDYPRARWLPNALHHQARIPVEAPPPVLMVSRLDGPTPLIVRRMILDSVRAELQGLDGKLVVDAGASRNLGSKGARLDEYGRWDQHLKNLAAFARSGASLPVHLDEAPGVIQPAQKVEGVALYAGWYSVRNYVPAFEFSPGAVALHIASFEAVSVRGPEEKGWVAGVLRDGAAATIGSVAEPYLQTFPRPDEFFLLLMTGKMTLAEAYWRTAPTTSWMMVLFGDPLYHPYRAKPVLNVEDLPVPLRRAVPAD